MPDTDTVIIYGASDDLIEIEGALREEFTPVDDESATYVALSNGVLLSILYTNDGIWTIRHLAGDGVEIARSDGSDTGERDDDGCPSYSDKAVVDGPVEWAVVGGGMVRTSPKAAS